MCVGTENPQRLNWILKTLLMIINKDNTCIIANQNFKSRFEDNLLKKKKSWLAKVMLWDTIIIVSKLTLETHVMIM